MIFILDCTVLDNPNDKQISNVAHHFCSCTELEVTPAPVSGWPRQFQNAFQA